MKTHASIFASSGAPLVRLTALLIGAAAGVGCSSLFTNEAQRGDGLLGYVYKSPGSAFIPVVGVSQDGGKILSAHARVYFNEVQVSGLVGIAGPSPRPNDSHVDILFLDKRGKPLLSTATGFRASNFSAPVLGEKDTSSYLAKVPSLPARTAKVQVVFHDAQKSECPHNRGS